LPGCVHDFLTRQQVIDLQQVAPEMIISYHTYLQQRPNKRRPGGLSESFIHHHIYSLRVFFDWLEQGGQIDENPMSYLQFPKPTSKPREVLSTIEMKELYQTCSTLREKAVLHLFYGCGLRRSEGVQLNIRDIHLRSGLLYVRQGKGGKSRTVPLTDTITEDLKNYYYHERGSYIKALTADNQQAFILNNRGNRMKGNGYNILLKRLLERAAINKEICLHGLRHSIATHLLESGLPVEYVRDFLGHKHLESTQIYTRVSQKQLRWS
jgi:integrase/recombinase XerD